MYSLSRGGLLHHLEVADEGFVEIDAVGAGLYIFYDGTFFK